MDVMDIINMHLRMDQKVILDVGVESFVGNVCSIDTCNKRIRLKNVENLQTKTKYSGTQIFHFSNVESITRLLDDSNQIKNLESTLQSPPENNHLENINEENLEILSKEEWDSINFTLDNSIKVFQAVDVSYFNAIKDLTNQQSFTILMEHCDFGRYSMSNLITLYSPDTKLVYIFDMMCMRRMEKQLKHILELEKPTKIMFNSKILRDHLQYSQNVTDINGIFDILVAYLTAFRDRESLDLISCVHKCFLIPKNYFKTEIKYNWTSRPLNTDHILFTAKKAIFLYKLYEYLLHKHLLKTFYETCQTFSPSFCSNKDEMEVPPLISYSDKTADEFVQEADIFNRSIKVVRKHCNFIK